MASLTTALLNSDGEQLRRLAAAWGIEPAGGDVKAIVRPLIVRMTDRWYLAGKIEGMSEAEKHVLFLLAESLQHWLTQDELAQRCRARKLEAGPAIESLSKLGLALVEDRQEFQMKLSPLESRTSYLFPAQGGVVVALPVELEPVVAAIQAAMARGDISHAPLRAYLETQTSRQLQELAKRWGLSRPHEYPKQHLVEQLIEAMSDADRVLATARLRHPRAYDLLTVILEKGGKAAIFGLDKTMQEDEIRHAYEALSTVSLLLETYIQGRRFLFIPLEVRATLRSPGQSADHPLLSPVKPEVEHGENYLAFVEDLLTVSNFVANNQIQLTSVGHIPQRVIARLASLLHVKEEVGPMGPRLSFLLALGRRLDLIADDGETVSAGDSARDWGRLSTAQKVRSVLDGWINFPRFEAPFGADYLGFYPDWSAARRSALKHLSAHCRPGVWYDLASLAHYMAEANPFLLAGGGAVHAPNRAFYRYKDEIDKATFGFTWNMIAYPLNWFGFVALGESSIDGTSECFSLTPLGAWALGVPGGEPPPEPQEKPFFVQPNFEVLSVLAGGHVLQELEQFADLVQADKARVYKLTKGSVLRGIDSGLKPEEMVHFLGQYAQKEVPQNVSYSVADWGRQHKPLSFSNVALVEVQSEDVLSELLASKKLSRYFSRRVSPTAAIVDPEIDLKKLSNELRKQGYSPQVSKEISDSGRRRPR